MRTDTAVSILNEDTTYHPGWEVRAEDYSHRFADTVCVHFTLTDAHRSERELSPEYPETVPGGARSAFPIYVGDVGNRAELYFKVTTAAVENFTHEFREFLRSRLTGNAPLHPHRGNGIATWATLAGTDPQRDYLFGLA